MLSGGIKTKTNSYMVMLSEGNKNKNNFFYQLFSLTRESYYEKIMVHNFFFHEIDYIKKECCGGLVSSG